MLHTQNKLLLTLDLIKDHLQYAFAADTTEEMKKEIYLIIKECKAACNKHLLWFAKLLESHYDGIVSHAEHKISKGKIEGINNKIKTLRRMGYGYPDDEYFFLKLFDLSRSSSKKTTWRFWYSLLISTITGNLIKVYSAFYYDYNSSLNNF